MIKIHFRPTALAQPALRAMPTPTTSLTPLLEDTDAEESSSEEYKHLKLDVKGIFLLLSFFDMDLHKFTRIKFLIVTTSWYTDPTWYLIVINSNICRLDLLTLKNTNYSSNDISSFTGSKKTDYLCIQAWPYSDIKFQALVESFRHRRIVTRKV